MVEKEITIDSGGTKLAGTLCLPSSEGNFPAVLMVHGSGPLDRDENTARGPKLNIFNNIAHFLADKGIASLRYDKRGCGRSEGDFWEAGFYDLIRDAKTVYEHLVMQESIKKDSVFLLGHSEGCHIVQKVFIERPDVAGLILLSPTMQKLEPVMMWQAENVMKAVNKGKGLPNLLIKITWKLTGNPKKATAAVLRRARNTDKASVRYWGQKLNARWLREIMEYEPEETTRSISCPILAITGEKDVQVDAGDLVRLAELATGEVDYHIVPNLTHILRLDGQEHSIFRYKQLLKSGMDSSVLDIIGDWLQKRV